MTPNISLSRMRTVLCLTGFLASMSLADNVTQPIYSFMTRPDLEAPILDVTLSNDQYVTPGYIFATPSYGAQPGPYIYDNSGNLVWAGFGTSGSQAVFDMKVCDYNGSPGYLCYTGGVSIGGYGRAAAIVMDNTYRIVTSIKPGLGRTGADLHEFNMQPGGKTAIISVYETIQYDLSAYGVSASVGWLLAGAFQEIDVVTGAVIFDWNGVNHVDPSESYVMPNGNGIAGDGKSPSSPWDVFHLNSIDKTPEGDYLVSFRHTNTIYKVSGTDGSIIWRLGGKKSNFSLQGLNFSSQHDARFQSANTTVTILSIFDNGDDGTTNTAPQSGALIIAANNDTHTATLVQAYYAPDGELDSASQGNFQVLPNGNVFEGFGSNPNVAEFTNAGTAVWYANLGKALQNYRWYKFNWTAAPIDTPKLWTYAQSVNSDVAFYVSWNGATEVGSYMFHVSNDTNPASFTTLGPAIKAGFETMYTTTTGYTTYAFVEALAADGKSLGNSSTVETFVPSSALAAVCGTTQCAITSQ